MIKVEKRIEGRRGCGYRKPGGIYLVAPKSGMACCKLPFPLTVCPCCGTGIKPTRGWTWVDVDMLFFPNGIEKHPDEPQCHHCPLNDFGLIGRAGLLWVGEQYYKTTEDFLAEANTMGISRRISSIPRDFKLGETWVLLAHRKAILGKQDAKEWKGGLFEAQEIEVWKPAIFSVFKPAAIEYVVHGNETQKELENIVKRGMTPIDVNPRKAYQVAQEIHNNQVNQ